MRGLITLLTAAAAAAALAPIIIAIPWHQSSA